MSGELLYVLTLAALLLAALVAGCEWRHRTRTRMRADGELPPLYRDLGRPRTRREWWADLDG